MRRNWSRDETLLAFELYFRLSPKEIRDTNAEIIGLAEKIGRVPGAVEAKLFNIQALDPYSIDKKGLQNNAKMVYEIWDEYLDDKYGLIQEMCELRSLYSSENVVSAEGEEYLEGPAYGCDVKMMQKSRRGQQFFRNGVLANNDCRCCITGIDIPELIIASHIKPWCECSDQEKVDIRNGLCLNRLHDGLFDTFRMTVTPEYRVIYSEDFIKKCNEMIFEQFFKKYEGQKITLPIKTNLGLDFISYHNMRFTIKNDQSV